MKDYLFKSHKSTGPKKEREGEGRGIIQFDRLENKGKGSWSGGPRKVDCCSGGWQSHEANWFASGNCPMLRNWHNQNLLKVTMMVRQNERDDSKKNNLERIRTYPHCPLRAAGWPTVLHLRRLKVLFFSEGKTEGLRNRKVRQIWGLYQNKNREMEV